MDRRGFLSVSLTALSGVAAFFASIPFVKSFLPSTKARALAEPHRGRSQPNRARRGRRVPVSRRDDTRAAQDAGNG